MLVPGIFKLGRVSTMLQIRHLAFMLFFAGECWRSRDSCLEENLFEVGQLSICA